MRNKIFVNFEFPLFMIQYQRYFEKNLFVQKSRVFFQEDEKQNEKVGSSYHDGNPLIISYVNRPGELARCF